MKNILIALDLSATDSHLLNYASLMTEKFGSKLWLVHIAAPDPDFVGYGTGPIYIRDSRAKELKEEHQQLMHIMDDLNARSLHAEALLIQGPTVEMLELEVKKLGIDLLIIGSHRHGFFYETFVGHTSTRLLKHLSIPVMIIPLKDEA